MKVILLDNIRGIGQVGDVKDLSDGYARNFLLPRGLAKAATAGTVKDAEALKAKKLETLAMARKDAEALAAKIGGLTLELAGRANQQGKLFAGIEASQVAEALSAKAGARINPSQVRLDEHLKTVGQHPVTIELADGISASVTISIAAK